MSPLQVACALGALVLIWRARVEWREWREIRAQRERLRVTIGGYMERHGNGRWEV